MTAPAAVSAVTCLGCGCGCDDLTVRVSAGRIADVNPPCPLARAWFGDGAVPTRVLLNGAETAFEAALTAAAETLTGARGRILVLLAPELSTQAQRNAVALADVLRASVDTATSEPAAAGLLAAQRRGRAAATLGEVRNRADVLLFWGVDPAPRYPRYLSRYALDPIGTHVAGGRSGRTVIAVSVGQDRGPSGADIELALTPEQEITALSVLRAVAAGNALGELPSPLQAFADLGARLVSAKYAVLVHDAEPGAESSRDPFRAEGIIALAQALNGRTRAALSTLRAGGNRSGAEAVLTWQTGYPMAVDFAAGVPRYAPAARALASKSGANGVVAVLVAGAAAGFASELADMTRGVPVVIIGPRASEAPFRAHVAIDTGVAGIHEGGTAYRMDDVPLPLRLVLPGQRSAVETLAALLGAVRARDGGKA